MGFQRLKLCCSIWTEFYGTSTLLHLRLFPCTSAFASFVSVRLHVARVARALEDQDLVPAPPALIVIRTGCLPFCSRLLPAYSLFICSLTDFEWCFSCSNSELVSRQAAAEVMKELYDLDVSPEEFAPFTGTGEANFLGGVARKYGAPFEVESCKEKFFEIYMSKYAVPGAGIGYKGARELVESCRAAGVKTAVASSADLIKVHANLRAANIPLDIFDTIVSADAFERLKPFPDIFLTAASNLGIDPSSCVVIEDAVAGVQAARAAGMRVIGVSTTLPELSMQEAGPDALLNDISAISVETLRGLRLRDGGEEAIAAARKKVQND